MIVIAAYTARFRDHDMQVPLIGKRARGERLEDAASTITLEHDRLDPDSHGR
jgi:hypothetical protein